MSVCWSGTRALGAYSLLGGGVPIPEQRLRRALDSFPLFSLLCFHVSDGSGPPLSPLQDSPGFLALQGILPVSSLLSSYCLLSVCFCVISRPPPAASGHPSSVHRNTLRLTANTMPFSSCPFPRPI